MSARILVVDDEELLRWSLCERLERAGYSVASAESGEAALEAMAGGVPDLVLLDVRLPGMDGVETLRQARALAPELAVVMMSAHSTVDVAVEAMKRGALDFLVKPFPFEALDDMVARALEAVSTRRRIASAGSDHAAGEGVASIVGSSAAMAQLRDTVARLGGREATTVLVEGESGTGKEVVARAIHYGSGRARAPFLQVNCAALAETLLESELFGHEKGAFTDAHQQKRGIFESAEGGSVMLDEIADLPASGQAKLLRLLENRTFRRVGGVEEKIADVRVIAATNVELEDRVAEGRFRSDLYFRLDVVRIRIPPLREHLDDLPDLVVHFLGRMNAQLKRNVRGVTPEAMAALARHDWPGNVRELRNVLERACILHANVEELGVEHLPANLRARGMPAPATGCTALELESAERRMIMEAIRRAAGNQTKAARLLGISRYTLRYRLRKHGLA